MVEVKYPFEGEFVPARVGGKVVSGENARLSTDNYGSNLNSNIDDVQKLADAVSNLNLGTGGSATPFSVGALTVNIPSRVPLNEDLTGTKQIRFRIYDYTNVSSLSLFIRDGILFQTHSITVPTSNGVHVANFDINSLSTTSKKTLLFFLVVNGDTLGGQYQVQVEDIPATDVSVDRTSLSTVQGTDVQDIANELERLYGIVGAINIPTAPVQRPLNTFTTSISFPASEINDFLNRNSIYVAGNDQRVSFQLPPDSLLTNQYPVTIELSHFGGTQRFDSGGGSQGPNNTIRVLRPTDYDPADLGSYLRRRTADGTNLQFEQLFRGDTAVITKESENDPWIIVESSADPRSSILPNGVFQLNTRSVGITNSLGFITGLTGYSATMGDAFAVNRAGTLNERDVQVGDVLVALVNTPDLRLTNNDDWLIIHNAGQGELTLTELRFLAEISEVDSFSYARLETRSDVTNVRVFLSPFILDHAPFINPSTDPDNPQSGEEGEYIGGDEQDGTDFDFQANSTVIGRFDNVATAFQAPNAFLYVDVDGGFNINERIEDIFVEHLDIDGQVINRYSLNDEFRTVVLPGSTDTYYVFDTIGASNNYSSITYHVNQTINVVIRTTNRSYNLGDAINVLPAIKDASIPSTKLDLNTQALLLADHSLTDDQTTKLDGLQTTSNPTDWTAGELYVKINDHASSDLSNYVNVGQQNGILGEFDHTRQVTFLVPAFVNATQLQRTDDNTVKVPITRIGTILGRQAFTATLPASSFNINNPVGDSWQVDGTASNRILSGAVNSFKVRVPNLAQDVLDLINNQSPTVHPFQLPSNLQRLNDDLTITTSTVEGWHVVSSQISNKLTREYAMLWDEDRRTFTGNYFDDIDNVQFTSFAGNNIFYYPDASVAGNTAFPEHQSYILNSNVRVSNVDTHTNILNTFNKIGGFEYSLQRPLESGDDVSMLRLGTSSSHPIISLDHDFGLHVNVGRGDGGQHSRTYSQPLHVDNGHWHSRVDETEEAEAEIVIPSNLTGSLTLTVSIQLDNNGTDEGTHTETITITNLDADQTIGIRRYPFGSFPEIDINFTYQHANTDLSTTRRVLFVRPVDPLNNAQPFVFNNAALTYNVTASRTITETWNTSETYAEHQINSGDPHDRFGLFDPELWNTERLRTPEKVVWQLVKWVDSDESVDPEVAIRVIVDGELKGRSEDDYKIRMHRPLSHFDTSIANFGNFIVGIANIQEYRYTPDFTIQDLQFANSNFDAFFGSFSNSIISTDGIQLNANFEILNESGIDRGIILTSENGTRYIIQINDEGALISKTL